MRKALALMLLASNVLVYAPPSALVTLVLRTLVHSLAWLANVLRTLENPRTLFLYSRCPPAEIARLIVDDHLVTLALLFALDYVYLADNTQMYTIVGTALGAWRLFG